MSQEKTLITNAQKPAKFLGFDVSVRKSDAIKRDKNNVPARYYNGKIVLKVAIETVRNKLEEYSAIRYKVENGRQVWFAKFRGNLMKKKIEDIVAAYNSEIRGFYNYYCIANNVAYALSKFGYIMEYSMYHTIAGKTNSTVSKVIDKYKVGNDIIVPYQDAKGKLRYRKFYNEGFKRKPPMYYTEVNDLSYTIAIPQQIYSCKTYNAFGKNHCTQHRIDYDTLYSHVLRKIRECARAALMDGEAVADRLTNTCEAEQREQREAMERSLTRDEERIEVLDKMVMRLYEDMIAGRISEQNFNTMLEKTQTEQTELKAKVSEGRKRLSDEVQLANDAKQWVEAIQEYANITELDAATLNRLIKEIVVHERIDEDKTRHISIEIHFNLKPIPEVEQVTA